MRLRYGRLWLVAPHRGEVDVLSYDPYAADADVVAVRAFGILWVAVVPQATSGACGDLHPKRCGPRLLDGPTPINPTVSYCSPRQIIPFVARRMTAWPLLGIAGSDLDPPELLRLCQSWIPPSGVPLGCVGVSASWPRHEGAAQLPTPRRASTRPACIPYRIPAPPRRPRTGPRTEGPRR